MNWVVPGGKGIWSGEEKELGYVQGLGLFQFPYSRGQMAGRTVEGTSGLKPLSSHVLPHRPPGHRGAPQEQHGQCLPGCFLGLPG